MPWQKNYDEIQVLENAMKAFWVSGYEATSMSDLVAATGINRGSIYAAFEGKHQLFVRALKHYDQKHRVEHLQRLRDEHPPREAIVKAFETAANNHAAVCWLIPRLNCLRMIPRYVDS